MTFLGTPTSNAMRMATCVLHFNHGIMVTADFSTFCTFRRQMALPKFLRMADQGPQNARNALV
jgi:hypothetical protein